jgi:hypothetical protein
MFLASAWISVILCLSGQPGEICFRRPSGPTLGCTMHMQQVYVAHVIHSLYSGSLLLFFDTLARR